MNEKLMFRILNSKDSMYDLCENMEQVYDNFYEPLYIEYQQLQKNLMNNLNTIRELEKNQNSVLQQENKQLKERIDKAIEYIEYIGMDEIFDKCLLEILKGEDNE